MPGYNAVGQGRYPNQDNRPYEDRPRKVAFKAFVTLELDFDLADALGNFILDNKCNNTALLALAHKLVGEA